MIRIFKVIGALTIAVALIGTPTRSQAGVFIGIGLSVNLAPPPLPVYVQPPVVIADEIWTPGYWAYGPYGYYWVPGTWVAAPVPGYLWTPGYWAFASGVYGWHGGYWGPHVGYYGGVNYGFGYDGRGYAGGGWRGGHFLYNTAVTNVNTTTINNVYVNRTVVNNYEVAAAVNRVSYNGGPNGIIARPTATQLAYRNERHVPPTAIQQQHIQAASLNRNYLASVNHGQPSRAGLAMPLSRGSRPAAFAPLTANDRHATAFGRFNALRGVAPNAASTHFNDAYRPATENGAGRANSYNAANPRLVSPRPTYGYRAANADRPMSSHPPASASRPANVYRGANGSYRANVHNAANTHRNAPQRPAAAAREAHAPAPRSEPGHVHDEHRRA